MDWAWFVSQVCEEFHCLPSAAVEEVKRDPGHLAETIVLFRAYARAKAVVDRAKDARDIPDTPMTDLVTQHEAELMRERWQRRRAKPDQG